MTNFLPSLFILIIREINNMSGHLGFSWTRLLSLYLQSFIVDAILKTHKLSEWVSCFIYVNIDIFISSVYVINKLNVNKIVTLESICGQFTVF